LMRKMREAILFDNFLEWRKKFLSEYRSEENEAGKIENLRNVRDNYSK